MIFGATQYWASDSMQWKLDADRKSEPRWDAAAESRMEQNEAIFRKPTTLQDELNREQNGSH